MCVSEFTKDKCLLIYIYIYIIWIEVFIEEVIILLYTLTMSPELLLFPDGQIDNKRQQKRNRYVLYGYFHSQSNIHVEN